MTPTLQSIHIQRASLPLSKPFTTAHGTLQHRDTLLVAFSFSNNLTSWGEAAPLPPFSTDTLDDALRDLALASFSLPNTPLPSSQHELESILDTVDFTSKSARFSIELAFLDAIAQTQHKTLAHLLRDWFQLPTPNSQLTRATLNATITHPNPSTAAQHTRDALQNGFSTLKVKVGGRPLHDDLARLQAISEQLSPETTLRLDANGSWSLEQTRQALQLFSHLPISLIEQPTNDPHDLLTLARETSISIAADESIRSPQDLETLLPDIDAIVLKPMWIGGLLTSLRMALHAQQHNTPTILTSALDSRLGRLAVAHLAAALQPLPCGLATGSIFQHDTSSFSDTIQPPHFILPSKPGLGDQPKPNLFPPSLQHAQTTQRLTSTIPHPLQHRARFYPTQPAIVCDDRVILYRDLLTLVQERAQSLRNLSIQPGDFVPFTPSLSIDSIVQILALTTLPATLVALHPAWTDEERTHALHTAAHLQAFTPPTPQPPNGHIHLAAPLAVVFSSGTTGSPKAVPLSWNNVLWSATGSAIHLGHDPADIWLSVLPPCHVGGLSILLRCLLLGTTVALHDTFDPKRVAHAISSHDATLVSLVPTMLERVLPHLQHLGVHPSFRAVLLGGGPIPDGLLDRCRSINLPVCPTYGMSEAASQITTLPPHASRTDSTWSAGVPLLWTEVRIQDTHEDERGGPLLARGPTISTSAQSHNGWLETGDIAAWSPQHDRLHILDRRTDRIVTGGENVSPRDVEDTVLNTFDDIEDICVVGLPDPQWGHRVAAALVLKPHASWNPSAFFSKLITQLAHFKVPREAFLWNGPLPRNSMGKLNRRAVRRALRPPTKYTPYVRGDIQ